MKKPVILIVDDETGITKSLARSLRDQFSVLTADTGREALDILTKENVAIILTDQRMPGMTGVELLSKAQMMRPHAIGILFSGYSDSEALMKAINLSNVHGYFSKPWNLSEIQSILQKALSKYDEITISQDDQPNKDELINSLNSQIENLRKLVDTISMTEDIDPHTLSEMEIIRQQEQQTREKTSLERLSSVTTTSFTAITYGSAGIKANLPDKFQNICNSYTKILDKAVETRVYKIEDSVSEETRQMADQLGFLRAGARDVIDIHNSTMQNIVKTKSKGQARIYLEEGRITVLELMGDLLSFYRFHFSHDQKYQSKDASHQKSQ